MSNVIQAEFFFVGNHLKRAVRFTDLGVLTSLVRKIEKNRTKRDEICDKFSTFGPLRKKYETWRVRRLAGKAIRLRDDLHLTVLRRMTQLAGRPEEVAIERLNRTFRPSRSGELMSLLRNVKETEPNAIRSLFFVTHWPKMFVFAYGECELCTDDPPQVAFGF